MEKMKNISGYLLFFLLILLPLGTILCSCLGYTFKLGSCLVFAVITALLAITAAVPADAGKVSSVLFALAEPLSLVNAVFCIFECSRSSRIWIILCMLICIVCCCILTVKYGKPLALKIITLILSAFIILPVGFTGFVMLLFGNIGETTVIRSIVSPGGTYYAEIIDDDQGALGGNTFVDVYRNNGMNSLDLFIFRITKNPQRIYRGDWGEFEDMEIFWKDENCLVIDSVEYSVE